MKECYNWNCKVGLNRLSLGNKKIGRIFFLINDSSYNVEKKMQ